MGKHFSVYALGVACVLAVLLPSCSQAPPEPGPTSSAVGELRVPAKRETPPEATPEAAPISVSSGAKAGNRRPLAEIFRGTGSFITAAEPARRSASVSPGGDISMNFVNADVRDVVKAVLGDLLQLNYVIDPNVQGMVTIQTSRPIQRGGVLPALEAALRLSGFALVKSADNFYEILPAANAPRGNAALSAGGRPAAQQLGFGVDIVPLRFVGVAEMQRLLEPLVPAGSIQATDTARNLIVVAGTQQERSAMLDDIALFDVDWLSGMSFAIFSPTAIDAKTLVKALNQVIGGRDSPIGGLVRLVPIEHQNAVLAISPQPKYLDELRPWVERLDHAGETVERRIYVYHVQHGRAADLAGVLTKLIRRGGDTEAQAAAIRPGETTEVVIEKPPGPGTGVGPVGVTPNGLGLGAPPAPLGAPYLPGTASSPPVSSVSGEEGRAPGIGTQGTGEVQITADEINNALLIMTTAREYAVIEAALRELDVVPLQVLLEAAIAEVTLTDDLKYGIQYFLQKGHNQVVLTDGAAAIAPVFPGLAYTYATGSNIRLILSAIEDVTRVDVVSSPEVLVLNNQTAILQVGDQVPIATLQAVSVVTTGAPVVNSIQYRDTGVTLKVTPRVNSGGMVMMDISQEVSDVAATTSSTLNSPTINQRRVSSTIAVQDGETIALGGLIRDSRTNSKDGIPVLQDIPLLGGLFRSTENSGSRTELLILITPHVVENLQTARSVTDELRRKLPLTRALVQGLR